MINIGDETFVASRDDEGNDYFCPMDIAGENGRIASEDAENCLEANVAGRYAGIVRTA
jgi:hypothetical protein